MSLDFLGTSFVDKDGTQVDAKAYADFKVVMVLYSASWWPGCTPFKENLKTIYNTLNADGKKEFQVIVVSGDKDDAGFKSTTKDTPWVTLPLGADKSAIEAKIPCTGYPTPGLINGKTGDVIDPDVFGKVSLESMTTWIAGVWSMFQLQI